MYYGTYRRAIGRHTDAPDCVLSASTLDRGGGRRTGLRWPLCALRLCPVPAVGMSAQLTKRETVELAILARPPRAVKT